MAMCIELYCLKHTDQSESSSLPLAHLDWSRRCGTDQSESSSLPLPHLDWSRRCGTDQSESSSLPLAHLDWSRRCGTELREFFCSLRFKCLEGGKKILLDQK